MQCVSVPSLGEKVRLMGDEGDPLNYNRVNMCFALIHLLAISRHLERVADHATNIAEDVIYMLKGQIVLSGVT